MIMKIKKMFGNLRVFKRIRVLMISVDSLADNNAALRRDNYALKGQLMDRRKVIKDLGTQLVTTTNDLNLLGEELDKVEVKKKKASLVIAQLVGRRKEFLKRIRSSNFVGIDSLADYKYFLSEPFIKDAFEPYTPKKTDIDSPSAIRGLGILLNEIKEEKTDEFTTP